ncbi:MAG: argininosuccinate lyase [Candidatus Sumerlaeaceae bacterium]
MAKKPVKQSKQQFWGERLKESPEMRNIAYCAGRDVSERPMADAVLAPFDLWQNRAHVAMLAKQKIITPAVAKNISRGLNELERRMKSGKFRLNPDKEDIHTNIEHFVAEFVGADFSGTMHTGRSRNDQTTTVVRMFVRDRLLHFGVALAELIEQILRAAEKLVDVSVAGYTHYQPASVTTMGHWFASYAQALLRDLERVMASYERVNVCPLGAAASFGTSWPIDRAYTAKLLGFRAVQENTLDCITNRWEMEADAACAVEFAMTHLSIIAQDLILLSTPQFGIIEIADRYVTGSSIMPQKRNPDFAEVTRAKATLVQNLTSSLFGIARGALSGYNRDTQWTKYLILDLFDEVQDAPVIFAGVFKTLKVNAERAEQSARENFVNAVDVADALAQESGLPFRTSYEITSRAVKLSEGQGAIDIRIMKKLAAEAGAKKLRLNVGSPAQIASRKKHAGGPAPATVRKQLQQMHGRNAELSAQMNNNRNDLQRVRSQRLP